MPIEKAYENEMAKNLQLNRKNEGNTANYVRIESLKETVFEKGATYHFIKDSCAFYFECDCCSGLYVFPTDSTFYSISNCMNDEIVRQGTYRLADFELRLIFDQWVQRKMVKTALESDTTPDEVIIQRKKVEPMVKNYFTTKCGDLIKLTDSLDESLATEASLNYANIMKELAENKLIGQ
ncbi:hypothetical protein GC194_04490 [bacterium]|nr:hypothetical protein [bacterium]